MLSRGIAKRVLSPAKQAYVYSLGVLVSFALESKGDSEMSEELAGLLHRMMGPNAADRPDIKLVSEVCTRNRDKSFRLRCSCLSNNRFG